MADGIAKGVGEQLGNLGKQIAVDIAQVPAKIVGLDKGTNESVGQGTGGKSQTQKGGKPADPQKDQIVDLKKKNEADTQKQLAQARRLLDLIMRPVQSDELSPYEKLEREELEKKKQEIAEEKKRALAQLPQTSSKRPRGDLFGIKAKRFAGETGKNVKSQ